MFETNPNDALVKGGDLKEAPRLDDESTCRQEAEALAAVADTLATANPRLSAEFDEWRAQLRELIANPLPDSLQTEQRLESLSLELRRRWITVAQAVVVGDMKSPPGDYQPMLPVSGGVNYIYERVRGSTHAEQRLLDAEPDVPGWQCRVLIFRNGMAAIAAVLALLRERATDFFEGEGVRVDAFIGYFETLRLLRLFAGEHFRFNTHRDVSDWLGCFSRGETHVLFFELVAYDWRQTVIGYDSLRDSVRSRPEDRPWVLVVDSTLLGPTFDMGGLLRSFADRAPFLAVDVRSGLKLDQVGLEFANAGVVKVFTPDDIDSERPAMARSFCPGLVSARKVMGTGLDATQNAILDAPWIFHQDWMQSHSAAVFRNNRQLALALRDARGIFSRVNHPALRGDSESVWAESPIVVFELLEDDDSVDNHRFLLTVIANEIRRRNLAVSIGCSFGFRQHRCEIVVPESGYVYDSGKPRGYLKFAMGSRRGPSLQGVIVLLRELAGFESFTAMRTTFSHVNPQRSAASFPDLQALRLTR